MAFTTASSIDPETRRLVKTAVRKSAKKAGTGRRRLLKTARDLQRQIDEMSAPVGGTKPPKVPKDQKVKSPPAVLRRQFKSTNADIARRASEQLMESMKPRRFARTIVK